MSNAERLLIFSLSESRYGLPLHQVCELLEPTPSFPIPQAPYYYCGAISLHGKIVALLDAAAFFGTGEAEPAGKIVVLESDHASLALKVGLTVDIVSAELVLEEEEGDDPLFEKILVMPDGDIRCLNVGELLKRLETGMAEK